MNQKFSPTVTRPAKAAITGVSLVRFVMFTPMLTIR